MGANINPVHYLVDPELIVPSEEYETDMDFWYRMCLVPDYRGLAVLGAYTRSSFDLFIENKLDLVYQELSSFLTEPDVWSLYNSINNLPDGNELGSGIDGSLDERVYQPKYGSSENRYTMQCDLCDVGTQLILTDQAVWDSDELASCEAFGNVTLFDISGGTTECVRNAIRKNPSYAALRELSTDAFPNLLFCNETWSTTRKLVGDERENARIMLDYFSVLNDSALAIWNEAENNHIRISRMGGLGVDCSPENGETDNNNKRVAERRFWLDAEPIEMNWHAKLFRNRNRIYFVVDTVNDRVVIGGLTEHFDTR